MAKKVSFLEDFFKSNSPEVSKRFLETLCLPKDSFNILQLYYVEHKEQKQIAELLRIEERTVRARLLSARELCYNKSLGWLSYQFSYDAS